MSTQEEEHRIEYLEAEIRRLRQMVRNLSDAVLNKSPAIYEMAHTLKNLIDPKKSR